MPSATFDRPYVISWNLTYRCNLACEHCYLDAGPRPQVETENFSDRSELTTQQCFAVIDDIVSFGPESLVILTGGEPLLRRDILEIIRYAAARDLWVVVGTNGVKISETLANLLKKEGVRGLALSLDALTPARHDTFRQVEGAWQNTVKAYPRTADFSVFLNLGSDVEGTLDGDREPDSYRPTALRKDRSVDPDHFPSCIDQRPATVAWIDGRIRLDHPYIHPTRIARRKQIASDCTYDSGGYGRLRISEQVDVGIADGDHPLADEEICTAAQCRNRQVRSFDLEHTDIAQWVLSQECGVVVSSITGRHDDLFRTRRHVLIGNDDAIFGNDEARAKAWNEFFVFAREKEKIPHAIGPSALATGDVDADRSR